MNYILWIVNLAVLWLAFYATEPLKNAEFDSRIYENFVNSFMRPVWALGVGWIILACTEGYGGERYTHKNITYIHRNEVKIKIKHKILITQFILETGIDVCIHAFRQC